jgi:PGF-pre-PGF domain-containing protein
MVCILKKILLIVVFLVILSSVGFAASCLLGDNYIQDVDNSTCNGLYTNGFNWTVNNGYNITSTALVEFNGTNSWVNGGSGNHLFGTWNIYEDATYNATSENTTVNSHFNLNGTFTHNSGRLIFGNGEFHIHSGDVTLYDVEYTGASYRGFQYGNITIANNLHLSSTGTIYLWPLTGENLFLTLGSGATVTGDDGYLGIYPGGGGKYYIKGDSSGFNEVNSHVNITTHTNAGYDHTLLVEYLNFTKNFIMGYSVSTQRMNLTNDCYFRNLTVYDNGYFYLEKDATLNVDNLVIDGGDFYSDGAPVVLTGTLDSSDTFIYNTTGNNVNPGDYMLVNSSVPRNFNSSGSIFYRLEFDNADYYNLTSNATVLNLTVNEGTILNVDSGVTLIYCESNGNGTINVDGSTQPYDCDLPELSPPNITLISPADDNTTTHFNRPVFSFSVTENDDHVNCTLYLNNTVYGKGSYNSSLSAIKMIPFKKISNGYYDWNVSCSDQNINTGNSDTRGITISFTDNFGMCQYVDPTPNNQTSITTNGMNVLVPIKSSTLTDVKYEWNDVNYTLYDNSLLLDLEFDNIAELGDNSTYVVDQSMYGNNLTLTGSYGFTSDGKYNGGLNFYGSPSSYGQTGDIQELKLLNTDFTIEVWAKSDKDSYGSMGIIGRELDWNFMISGQKGLVYLGGQVTYFEHGAMRSSSNKWTYYTITYKTGSNQTELWTNADLNKNLTTLNITETATAQGVIIGNDARSGNGQNFNGAVDSIRIWNRSLSADEIKQHYHMNLRKLTANDWEFYSDQKLYYLDRQSDSNFTYNLYTENSTTSDSSGLREIEYDYIISKDDIHICHYRDCKEGVMILSGDANSCYLHSGYACFENSAFYNSGSVYSILENETSHKIIYTFDIDTRCYKEGGECSGGGISPSAIEMKELMWEGHCVDFDGYEHNTSDQYPYVNNAFNNATVKTDLIDHLNKAKDAFYYNLTGVPIITGFFPFSDDHYRLRHGEIAFNNASFVYMGSRSDGGYYHDDLVIPQSSGNRYIEFGQTTRDDYDFYEQAMKVYDREGKYVHVWGHNNVLTSPFRNNITSYIENSTIKNYYWSASLEQAARYVVERDATVITEVDMTGDPKEISLTTIYGSGINTSMYGIDIYKMPLTINASSYSDYPFVYESVNGVLTRLYSYTNGNDVMFEVIPNNQTIYMYSTAQQIADKPFINVTVSYLSIINTTGDSVRDGEAYEVIVSANDSNSKYTNWSLSVVNAIGGEYLNWLNHTVNNTDLDMNDLLTNERGKILYYNEKGYTNATLFQFIGNLTNIDGDSRILNLTNVNGSISFGIVNSTTALVSTDLSQNITVSLDGFNSSRTYNVTLFDSSKDVLSTSLYANPADNINFSYDLSGVSSVEYIRLNTSGDYCSVANECDVDYCVNNYCRSTATYCGDGFCDTGETNALCSADCAADATVVAGGILYQCMDNKDNDGDGLIDLSDPGCSSRQDDDETDELVIVPMPVDMPVVTIERLEKIIEEIIAGQEVEINILELLRAETDADAETVVTGLVIVSKESGEQVKVQVSQTTSAPKQVEDEVTDDKIVVVKDKTIEREKDNVYDVYQYVEIDADVEIESAEIEFEVTKQWMSDKAIADVVLLHYDGEWTELETTYLQGEDPLVFFAETGSFSVFAVGTKEHVGDNLVGVLFGTFVVMVLAVIYKFRDEIINVFPKRIVEKSKNKTNR